MGNALLKQAIARNALLLSLFPEQLAVLNDKSPKVCVWTTRRAGKTQSVLSTFIDDALTHPHAKYAYIALTSPSAEDIAWGLLKKINRTYNFGMVFKEAKLKAIMPNGAQIKLYGADKPGFAERLYGQSLRKVAVDEAAFYRIDINQLIDDFLEPCIIDENGQIYLMSIPGHYPRGLFWDITKGFSYKDKFQAVASETRAGWSCHRWTTEDNPHMRKQFLDKIAQKKREDPEIEKDPVFIRNYRGAWVSELGERVYKYQDNVNAIDSYELKPGDNYILGIDFGWDDQTAFSVCVWREDSPVYVELESHAGSGMLLDEIASYVKRYQELYPGIVLVGDPAHKQLFEEFRRRFDLPILEGEKPKKYDWIQTINSDLKSGKIKIVKAEESQHAEEMVKLTWHIKRDGFRVEQPGATNDCCDAFMLAYRQAYHYRYVPIEEIQEGSEKYWREKEEKLIEGIEEQLAERNEWYD